MTILSLIWGLSNAFYWLEYFAVIFFFCAAIFYMFRYDIFCRKSVICAVAGILSVICIFAFDYNRPPRLSNNDLKSIEALLVNSGYEQALAQIDVSNSERGFVSNSCGYTYKFNQDGSLQSRTEGYIHIYVDEESAIDGYESYTAFDTDENSLMARIYSNKYQSDNFQAYTSNYCRNYDITFLPVENYFSCNTTIRYKNAVIHFLETTDIAGKSKMKHVLLSEVDYVRLLTDNVGGGFEDYKVF